MHFVEVVSPSVKFILILVGGVIVKSQLDSFLPPIKCRADSGAFSHCYFARNYVFCMYRTLNYVLTPKVTSDRESRIPSAEA